MPGLYDSGSGIDTFVVMGVDANIPKTSRKERKKKNINIYIHTCVSIFCVEPGNMSVDHWFT